MTCHEAKGNAYDVSVMIAIWLSRFPKSMSTCSMAASLLTICAPGRVLVLWGCRATTRVASRRFIWCIDFY